MRLKGIKAYFEPKAGKVYCYHRKSGIRLTAPPGTLEFLDEYKAAESTVKPKPSGRPGSLALIIAAYRASHEFLDLRSDTRKEYERSLSILSGLGTLVMSEIKSPDVVRIRDNLRKSRNRTAANKSLATLSILFSFAVEHGLADGNPVRGVRKLKGAKDTPYRNRPWSKCELDTVLSHLPQHLALPFIIARWTGLRIGDVVKLKSSLYDGKVIQLHTSKRDVLVSIPAAQPLKLALEMRPHPNATTACLNSLHKPWTKDGFQTSFFKVIRKLEKEGLVGLGLTLHGLRHTVATEMRELGYDPRTIADMLGQKSEVMAQHYSRAADLQKKLKPVIEKMESAEEARTKMSRKSEKSV